MQRVWRRVACFSLAIARRAAGASGEIREWPDGQLLVNIIAKRLRPAEEDAMKKVEAQAPAALPHPGWRAMKFALTLPSYTVAAE